MDELFYITGSLFFVVSIIEKIIQSNTATEKNTTDSTSELFDIMSAVMGGLDKKD